MLIDDLPRKFGEPWWNYLRLWPGLLLYLLVPASIIAFAVWKGETVGRTILVAGVVVLLLSLLPLTDLAWTIWNVAARVTVTTDGIVSRSFCGRRVGLAWSDVIEVREFDSEGLLGERHRQVRLLDADDARIAIDGRLPGFDELVRIIHVKTRHARRSGDPRNPWQRQLIPG